MTTSIDTLSRSRIWIVVVLAIGYSMSQIVGLSFIPDWTEWSQSQINLVDNIGFGINILAVISFAILFLKSGRMGESVKAALHDDLVKHHVNKALQFGYKVLFVISLILLVVTKDSVNIGVDLTAGDVARIITTVILVVPYLRFAYLESRHA